MSALSSNQLHGRYRSAFHDGIILEASSAERDLSLRVRITYLAQRIEPASKFFFVRLHDVRELAFETWPEDDSLAPETLHGVTQIFTPPLDILSGEVRNERVQAVCNQPSSSTAHCGGTLSFRAASATVSDENGKQYSLKELFELADGYWRDWENRSKDREGRE